MAGHSLGEYTALVCAGALDFPAALELVRTRALAMQQAVPEGTGSMAAILGLDDALVHEACREASASLDHAERVAVANFNAPGQIVIAGHRAAVERAVESAKKRGAKRAIVLPVSVPSHCELMRPAAVHVQAALAATTLRTPRIPVLNNIDVAAEQDPARIKEALVRQLYCPVRWVESVLALRGYGATHAIEFGPGKILVGLIKRIDKEMVSWCISDEPVLREAAAALAI
jgi:[acyl-carrier-protein] S-malonyltransferase